MGNIDSCLRGKRRSATISKIPEFSQAESDKEWEERQLDFYLGNGLHNIDRLHIYHFLKRHIFQSNFASPIEFKLIEGCKVLDVGCGPGTWLLDLSNKYENSYFFGIDIKPVYPQEIKPNNLEFFEGDILNGLSFRDDEFDFTHIESMSLILTKDQWDFVLSELIRVTKPGGYIEITGRFDGHDNDAPIYRKLTSAVTSVYSKRNIDFKFMCDFDSKFQLHPNIGEVHRVEKEVISGPNGGKIGLVLQELGISYYTSEVATKNLSAELGISEEEYINMVERDFVQEIKQNNLKSIHVRFWTQKQG